MVALAELLVHRLVRKVFLSHVATDWGYWGTGILYEILSPQVGDYEDNALQGILRILKITKD
jgi:hypothetical protein